MFKKLTIVSAASEVSPFSKSGGLADVVSSLAKSIHKLGHQIIIVSPFYSQAIDQNKFNFTPVFENISLETGSDKPTNVSYFKTELTGGLPVYFVANDHYYGKKKHIYGSSHENQRFYLFNLAVLKLIELLQLEPDVIHCHDWHTGLIPELVKKTPLPYKNGRKVKTVFTIHNLLFQLGRNWWEVPLEEKDYGRKNIPAFDDPRIEYTNFAKRAITNADIVNTVSEQYAEEILTKDFGQDLHRILYNNKHKLYGIINGIDENEYNPATDPGLAQNYNAETSYLKKANKEALLKHFGLPFKKTPVIGMTSRIVEQKGFDILSKVWDTLLSFDLQVVIMGDGDKKYINELNKFSRKYPKKLSYRPFDQQWETSIYAGADMLLLPSRFEPCGLNQLYALRYGCIPLVHKIGGLADTVTEFRYPSLKGNGFIFKRYHEYNLLMALARALQTYEFQEIWEKLVKKALAMSSFWKVSAQKYVNLYLKALKTKQ